MLACKATKLVHILTGIVIGFILTSQFRTINYENFKKDILFQLCSRKANAEQLPILAATGTETGVNENVIDAFESLRNLSARLAATNGSRLLLVGVMTASKFIDTRAATIYRTWASQLDGDIIFFTSSMTKFVVCILFCCSIC